MAIVKTRPLTQDEKDDVESFQDFLKVFLEYFDHDKSTINDFRSYQNLKKALKRYHNKAWCSVVFKWFNKYDKEILKHFNNRRINNNSNKNDVTSTYNKTLNALKSGNIKDFKLYGMELKKYTDAAREANNDIFKNVGNPLKIVSPLFFQSNNLVSSFSVDDMKKLSTKDISKYNRTYLKYPYRSSANYQYIVHFINELTDKDGEVEISKSLYTKYTKFLYDYDDFDSLTSMVDDYLRHNSKQLLPKIFEKLKEYPELVSENYRRISGIKKVYRGISTSDYDEVNYSIKDIIQQDKDNKYVATTTTFHTAQLFAADVGHIDGLRNAKTDGYIITYNVEPSSILLDTEIFGGIFGEREIIINAQKAEVESVDTFLKYDYINDDDEDFDIEDEDY